MTTIGSYIAYKTSYVPPKKIIGIKWLGDLQLEPRALISYTLKP